MTGCFVLLHGMNGKPLTCPEGHGYLLSQSQHVQQKNCLRYKEKKVLKTAYNISNNSSKVTKMSS